MKTYERLYSCATPFLLPLHGMVRRSLRTIAAAVPGTASILDVGGRRSPYTIGVEARITITDLPRETAVQEALGLGVSEEIVNTVRARRSNIEGILLDDMTRSKLPDAAYDCVVAVEVLEHVEEDALFLRNVRRILKPGGVFLMTTPNGDFVKNVNPDHKRHYTREQLRSLLSLEFSNVTVEYAIADGLFQRLGLSSWSLRRPIGTVLGMAGNLFNSVQSSRPSVRDRAWGTHHLIATAKA